jgi:GNAT superfamily N-acetyltransferase
MQNDALSVRPIALADAGDLQRNCFPGNALEEVESGVQESLDRASRKDGIQLVAELDGKIVGTLILTRNWHPFEAHRAELTTLVVNDGFQGQGISHRLVDATHAHARSMGVEILEVGCRAGAAEEKVYPQFGFKEYGRLPGAIIEPSGERRVFDAVYFYQPVRTTP